MDTKQRLLNFLNETNVPYSIICKELGVSRNTLYNWQNGGSIRIKNENKINEYLNKEERPDKMSMHTKLIELQEEKIQRLENDLFQIRNSFKKNTPESSHWDDIKFHYKTEVELHWTSFGVLGRTIWSVSNFKEQSKILGYSESKLKALWDVGTKYADMSQHPIDGILHQDTKDELQDIAKTLPAVFKAIKDMIGSHYIPTKLMYKRKDGTFVGAISYNKIDWRTQKVYSKIAFLLQ